MNTFFSGGSEQRNHDRAYDINSWLNILLDNLHFNPENVHFSRPSSHGHTRRSKRVKKSILPGWKTLQVAPESLESHHFDEGSSQM